MARFNLEDYETVEDRIKRFYLDNEDGRIVTHNLTTASDREQKTWVVYSAVFLSAGDSGNKRASRTEMQKVASAEPIDYLARLEKLTDIEQIRLTYAQAKAAGAAKEVLEKIKARGESFNSGSKDTGDRTRVSNGSKSGKS